ncbi:MAG: DUF5696 domain-containing protein [Defluviitaleaceae bacterium]|nr:DUF5696 domain-containing protein [Defluviitaleaceae bacterium]
MKRLIALVLVLAMLIPSVGVVRTYASASVPSFANFELVYENAYAVLFVDERSNNIRVFQKASGEYFDTLVTDGQSGSAFIRDIQRSDFDLEILLNEVRGIRRRMNSYTESVSRSQVEYTNIPGGVSARFMVGDPDAIHLTMFPMFISRERLNYFVLDHLTQQERDDFGELYRFTGGRYVRRHPTFVAATGEPNTVAIPWLRRAHRFFYEVGTYTFDELAYDNDYWEYLPFEPAPLVHLAVEYTLCGPDLIITVPRSGMELADESQPFINITMNPYFLSASEEDEGYIFIPDGSGGIIMFNNGMTGQEASLPVFGRDPLYGGFRYHEPFNQATLPVYGIVRNNTAILAIIEEGAPVATIHANVSGRIDEYNRVYASFELLFNEAVPIRGRNLAATNNRFLDEMYDFDIRQRFVFLSGVDANYVGMARAYQQYLIYHSKLNSNGIPPEYAPFFVEFIATTPRSRVLLGIQYTENFAMTSTEDAQNILQSMTDQGVRNIHAQYTHWANGGMRTTDLHRLRPLRSIGGTRGMRDLEQFTVDSGLALYPTVRAVTFREVPGRIGGVTRGMLSRDVTNGISLIAWHGIHTRTFAGSISLLSPVHWVSYVTRIGRNFTNMGLSNIAVSDLGGMLFGDYRRRNTITRLESQHYANEALEALASDLGLMLANPNVYAFAHANIITDLPFSRGAMRIVDFNIPFVQMVLGEHIPFSMPAYNIDAMAWRGFNEYMLRAVESRSAMKLILTYANEREFFPTFQNHGFHVLNNMFFQTAYHHHWEARIGEYYARFNAFYQAVRGAYITAHTVTASGMHVVVEYSNGITVLINYCDSPWEHGGQIIAPLSFEVI